MSKGPENNKPPVDSNESTDNEKEKAESLNPKVKAVSETQKINVTVTEANLTEDELMKIAGNKSIDKSQKVEVDDKVKDPVWSMITKSNNKSGKMGVKKGSPEWAVNRQEAIDDAKNKTIEKPISNIKDGVIDANGPPKNAAEQKELDAKQKRIDEKLSVELGPDGKSNLTNEYDKVLQG
ncbi:MAG: hypothetical protein O2904_00395 [bacterium]|nr:hypothetical protein [bacterium]